MKREDLKEWVTLSRGNCFGKPDLHCAKIRDRRVVIKDVAKRNFVSRWTLGLWLIHREWKIYSQLKGVKGVPNPIQRIDLFSFVVEFVPGKTIERGEPLTQAFFSELERMLQEVHARGVVHLDLRHKGNILVSESGEPILIDFNSSFAFKGGGLLHRFLFPVLRRIDDGGFLKLKERAAPSSMTPEERISLKRFQRIRKLWIFN